MREVTDATFAADVLAEDKPVLVDFWAPWCAPCRLMAPLLDQLAADRADELVVAKLDVDDNPESAARYGVLSVPTLHFFHRGAVVRTLVGLKPKTVLLAEVDAVLRAVGDGASVRVDGES